MYVYKNKLLYKLHSTTVYIFEDNEIVFGRVFKLLTTVLRNVKNYK